MTFDERFGGHVDRAKGRADGRGERHPLAKLTDDDVREIRKRLRGIRGLGGVVAKEYGVSQATISYILQGKTWKHIL